MRGFLGRDAHKNGDIGRGGRYRKRGEEKVEEEKRGLYRPEGKSTEEGGKDEGKVTLLHYVGRAPIGSLKKHTKTERKRLNWERLDKKQTITSFLTFLSPPLFMDLPTSHVAICPKVPCSLVEGVYIPPFPHRRGRVVFELIPTHVKKTFQILHSV